jgi:hypothetical protein
MNELSPKIVGSVVGFVVIVISGIVTSSLGKPYNPAVFGLHKIAAVGTIVLLVTIIRALLKTVEPGRMAPFVFAITGLLFLGLIVSGALLALSVGPAVVLHVHQAIPVPVIVFSALSVYLLVGGGALALVGGPR